jgi:two-component system, chemotaxis family, protein-glutamate methylesterase/glutaminase
MELNHDPRPGPELVVIGASWGGLEAVGRLLDLLPATLACPLALVQHRGPQVSQLARLLAQHTSWPVCEADDKQSIVPATVYLAPPGYHLLVQSGGFALSTEAPVRYSRPSIDVLFDSAADAYGPRLVGVLLTGANDDGARGLARIHAGGGLTMVQDPATAARPDMPAAALARMTPDLVAPVDGIAARLVEVCGTRCAGQDLTMPHPRAEEDPR